MANEYEQYKFLHKLFIEDNENVSKFIEYFEEYFKKVGWYDEYEELFDSVEAKFLKEFEASSNTDKTQIIQEFNKIVDSNIKDKEEQYKMKFTFLTLEEKDKLYFLKDITQQIKDRNLLANNLTQPRLIEVGNAGGKRKPRRNKPKKTRKNQRKNNRKSRKPKF